MTTYRDRLTEAMNLLATDQRTIFLGQSISYHGTGMTPSFATVPRAQLLELPVFEDTQLGMAIGLSLAGYFPICVYPRINFLLLAMNQLVLHLDAIPRFSAYHPKVIIRTAVASPIPLDPGPQHLGDYSYVLEDRLQTVTVRRLRLPEAVIPEYIAALARADSTILVEYTELYDKIEVGS